MGKSGIERCFDYTRKHNKNVSENEIKKIVLEYTKSKLLSLKDNFIRTSLGKKLAESLHNEMVEWIKIN